MPQKKKLFLCVKDFNDERRTRNFIFMPLIRLNSSMWISNCKCFSVIPSAQISIIYQQPSTIYKLKLHNKFRVKMLINSTTLRLNWAFLACWACFRWLVINLHHKYSVNSTMTNWMIAISLTSKARSLVFVNESEGSWNTFQMTARNKRLR